MKTLKVWYGAYAAAALAIILSMGCKTAGVYDPVKASQVVNAFTVPVRDTINRVIRNSPQHSDQIADYFRAAGNVVCKAFATKQVDPDQLLTEIDKATGPLQQGLDPLIVTTKNVAVALYKDFYLQRHVAQLDPEKWPLHVLEVMCKAINGGLIDAGKPGTDVKP